MKPGQLSGVLSSVPHYFFDLHNDIEAIDSEGRDFPDVEAAKVNAIREVREMMCESVQTGRVNLSHRIDVRDESGQVIHVVRFGEAVQVIQGEQPSK
jgi:hypothetical protein